ncbi:MAG: ROK family protein [Oscillospiraceae bacterium]|nr:ROK family protein [Oscillospiraceae bacterium]
MYNLGIDLGGTSIKAGVVDKSFKVIATASLPTAMPRPAHEIMDDIAKAGFMAVQNAGISFNDIEYIGIGSPGTVNPQTGILEFSGNLDMHKYPLKDELTHRFNHEVYVENDANCAAFAENLAGAAKGAKNAVAITLGTGVGSGIIIDGKIYSGFNYAGAEFGHTVILHNGRQCNCGRRGCWEVYASANAFVYQTKLAMLDHPESELWELAGRSLDNVDGKTAFAAMQLGDPTGEAVVCEFVSYVACGIVNIINIFQPDIMCIGGGLSNAGEALMTPLRSYIKKERFSKYSEKQTKFLSAILGNEAGIIGAANLYLNGKGVN